MGGGGIIRPMIIHTYQFEIKCNRELEDKEGS